MSEGLLLRQMALAAYGTQYLRGELELEDWYRHGAFWKARCEFRAAPGGRLLADDFALWLGHLRERGALRLSLHAAAGLPDRAAPRREECHLIVHFPDRHQTWAPAGEHAQWRDDNAAARFPDSRYYAGALDCHCLIGEATGAPEIAVTHWKTLAQAIATDLNPVRPIAPLPPYAPYHEDDDALPAWARLPLLPKSPRLPLPHQLLALLERERARFCNDANMKNDSSPYQHMDQDQADAFDDWGRRLDCWIAELRLRAANETRWGGADAGAAPATLERLVAPPAPRPLAATSGNDTSDTDTPGAAMPETGAASTTAQRKDSPAGTPGLLLACLVMTLLVLASAHILAASPWLALPLALLIFIFLKYRR
ncbi:MAG TPA: hypothetical protein DCW29_05805 [Janthinobacterium sp.]|nr:hypothetical protein [Janthinobacterium sp.]